MTSAPGHHGHGPATAWSVAIVCTDRGQHKVTRLAHYDHLVDGTGSISGKPDSFDVNGGWHSYTFHCPRCTRRPACNRHTFIDTYVRRASEAGAAHLDVSYLPF